MKTIKGVGTASHFVSLPSSPLATVDIYPTFLILKK
jgi:hypothetical protein